MKVSEQFKLVRTNFDISNHRFLNSVTDGVKSALTDAADIKLQTGKKSQTGALIELEVTGTKIVLDADDLEKLANTVRQTVDGLRNQSDLLSILDY